MHQVSAFREREGIDLTAASEKLLKTHCGTCRQDPAAASGRYGAEGMLREDTDSAVLSISDFHFPEEEALPLAKEPH